MALEWKWKDKCGECVMNGEKQDLYEGNAYLIALVQDEKQYCLRWFFMDKTHAKICMGLQKNQSGEKRNIFDDDHIEKITLYKNKMRNFNDVVCLFAKAFSNITIEIREEE